ncbi:MAG: histidinol dehydrogenase [Pseudomonadota bacterium]|nr:histidinol dehydrogenase [Pseudomonadota bacterium]
MKILKSENQNFFKDLKFFLQKRLQQNIKDIDESVKKIINQIIQNGDEALFKYTKEFDGILIDSSNVLISKKIRESYKNKADINVLQSFKVAIQNITKYHEKQKPQNYEIIEDGAKTSLIWKPIQSVGLYVPGGNAVYPSSLIMNAIPAKVAGVERIVVVTPSQSGSLNPYILALLDELNIKEVYQIGGAHAIAALAYGTESVKPVNKIFGPGNAYVASAKRQVFGKVGIDLIAGPSEIVVVADKDNKPNWVAADLIAQSEHDEKAQSILITDDENFSNQVILSINKLKEQLPRKEIINKSLNNNGLIIVVNNFDNVADIIDFIAPEHLHLQNKSRNKILEKVNDVGGVFMGEYASEVFGDYIIGTNHVLPTLGSAKFSSGLGVLDFMKRSSVVEMNLESFNKNQDNASKMASIENFEGHKLSVKIRQMDKK